LRFPIQRAVIASVIALVVLAAGPCVARETGLLNTDEVIIRYGQPLQGVAKDLAAFYPQVRKKTEGRLGWKLGYRPTLWIVKDRRDFLNLGAGRLTVALAVPARGLIVLDNSRVRVDPFSLGPTLTHELAHLILHRHIRDPFLPRWLDEGVAQWVSGGTAEIALMEGSGPRLKQAVLSGQWVPFRYLADGFPPSDPALSLAYEQSRSIVEYIVHQYGKKGLLRILGGLKAGKKIDAAVEEALPVSFPALEADWRDQLKRRVTWFSYLSDRLPILLFFAAAVLTVAGFIRLRIRRRNYIDDDRNDNF
jgi:Peptidase MA superfamily